MGYRMPPLTLTIRFGPETDYEGAEVVLSRRASLETVLRIRALGASGLEHDTIEAVRFLGNTALVSWNLDDDEGNPVPPTGDALLAQPADFGLKLLDQWQSVVGKASGEADAGPSSSDSSDPAPPTPKRANRSRKTKP